MTSNNGKEYTATFSLTQRGLNGVVTPSLVFEPLIEDPTKAPAIFEYMAHAYMQFLKHVNILGENGEVLDEDYLEQTDIHASVDRPTTKH